MFSPLFWQLCWVELWIQKNWWENSAKKLINSLKLSSLFSFMNKLLKKHTISALTTTVWLPVQVFRMNKHDGWKIIFYEVQIKKRFIVPAKDKGLRPLVESNRHMTHIDFTNVLKIGWVTILSAYFSKITCTLQFQIQKTRQNAMLNSILLKYAL